MKNKISGLGLLIIVSLLFSCKNTSTIKDTASNIKPVHQRDDGTISLKLDNADCYADMKHPSENSAEWNVVVSKSGRYNVWISCATLDTNDLKTRNSIMINIQDKTIQAHPDFNNVLINSTDGPYPYFKADSFIGSLYLQDTGHFYIQVVSDMILPKDYDLNESSAAEIAKLISVSFTPIPTR